VQEIVGVPFPFPRTAEVKTSVEFMQIRRYVESLVRQQYAAAHPEVAAK
jgi:hypothetical protein